MITSPPITDILMQCGHLCSYHRNAFVKRDVIGHAKAPAGSLPAISSPFVGGGLGRCWHTPHWLLRLNVIVLRTAASHQSGFIYSTRVNNGYHQCECSRRFAALVFFAVCLWGAWMSPTYPLLATRVEHGCLGTRGEP